MNTTPDRATENDEPVTTTFGTLFALYLDGVGTGIGSLGATVGIPQAECHAIATKLVASYTADPAVAETLREQVRERVSGNVSFDPQRMVVHSLEDSQ